jgi:hypothetical protein
VLSRRKTLSHALSLYITSAEEAAQEADHWRQKTSCYGKSVKTQRYFSPPGLDSGRARRKVMKKRAGEQQSAVDR